MAATQWGDFAHCDDQQRLDIQQGPRGDARKGVIIEAQETIAQLLTLCHGTKSTETHGQREQLEMLEDLETKILTLQDSNRSDLQMLRHVVQTLAERFDRLPPVRIASRTKRWSFIGPL